MTFAKKIAARLAQFTLLLAFVGLTSLPGLAQKRAGQPHIGQVQDSNHRHIVSTDTTDTNDVQTADQPDIGLVQDSSHRHSVSTDTNHVQTAKQPHIGLVQDWSHRHIVFTDTNDVQTRVKASGDLRALSFWVKRGRVQHPNKFVGGPIVIERGATANKTRKGGGGGGAISGVSVDWALPLGKGIGASAANYGGLAAGAYPAKYTFDINAAPDCTNDYIAMGLKTPGSATTPNVVGINNLYANSGGSGFCNLVTEPTAYFAYYTASANPTSMVVSLDGKKIAWVENAATAVFHVLAWQADDGTLAAPIDLSTRVVAGAPAVGSGNLTNLTLTGAVNDTNSSPYVDYTSDTAYVASNNGLLFKIRNVFCQTIASPAANSTCAGAAPSLDPAWTTNPVTVAATTGLTSPVVDTYLATPLVFVAGSSGTSLGSVFARVAADGTAPTTPSITPGRAASANGGVVDPPVLDVTNHRLYVTAGCGSANTNAVAVQNPYTSTGFGASVTANIGQDSTGGGTCPTTNMHAGTPDDTYITAIQNGTAGTGNMIFCGTTTGFNGPPWQAVLWKFPVAAGVMGTVASARSGAATTDGMGVTAGTVQCSAITDVFNSNFASQQERIYLGVGGTADGHLRSFDATFTTPAATPARTLTGAWTAVNGVVTFPIANSPITIGPGNYVVITGTVAGTCLANANVAAPGAEVISSTTTTITYAKATVGNPACTGTAAGSATSDNTIPGLSLVDITTPLVAQTTQATSGIIIDNVAATGSFAEASNIYFTQLAAGNIAGGSCPATATITTATRAGGVATITTSAAHGLIAGDTVTITGVSTAAYNGVFPVTAVTATTFQYALGGVSGGAGGSVFAKACIYKLSQSGLQ